MQLGDVEILEEEATPEAPPRRRRRWTLLLLFWALLGTVAAMVRHGGGVATLDPGEIGVVQTAEGVPLLSDRVLESAGTHIYVPVLQRFVHVEGHTLTTVVTGVARSRRGAAIPYSDGAVHHRVRPARVAALVSTLGPEAAARERYVQSAAARAVRLALGAREATALGDAAPIHAAVRARLEGALKARGIELVRFVPPSWRIDPAVADAVARLAKVSAKVHTHEESVGQHARAAAQRRTQTESERAGAHEAMRVELEAELALARASLAEAHRAADLQLERRTRAARLQRDETLARAKGSDAVARLEAQALAARVDAVRGRGTNLLDKAIADHVLPQLGARSTPEGEAEVRE